jgi:hypothetical protein
MALSNVDDLKKRSANAKPWKTQKLTNLPNLPDFFEKLRGRNLHVFF